jgi:hypothetical protein
MKEIHLALSGSPNAVDEVLVILQGVHQQIPTTPPQQHLAKPLPPPPDDTNGGEQTPKLSTEADRIKQKYAAIGKEENHTFGGVGSNIPNFNVEKSAATQPQAGPAAASAQKPASTPVPVTKAPENTAPAKRPTVNASNPAFADALGARQPARTQAPQPQPPKPQTAAPAKGGESLPLGAPRKKATPPPPAQSEPQQ